MKHPPYHLRPNKAVDRLTLIEAIKRVGKLNRLSEYTYYGFGGPYLEDFRLMYEFFPEIKLVSIEEDADTYKRQRFHLPCSSQRLRLKRTDFKSFLANYSPRDKKSIFWLDYVGLEYDMFEEFETLVAIVPENSVIKITLRAEPRDYLDKGAEFQKKFEDVMPDAYADPPVEFVEFAHLVQSMLEVASQRAIPGMMPTAFVPLASFCYSDGTGMLTLTGMVCLKSQRSKIREVFGGWEFANLGWQKPRIIDVPILSTRERLHLQHCLPRDTRAGKVLQQSLGYLIDNDKKRSERKLQQYADFHRYFPYFMKAIP